MLLIQITLPFWKFVWEIPEETWVSLHHWPQLLDTELVELGHVDAVDLVHTEEALLFAQNLFQVIPMVRVNWEDRVLTW